MAHFLAAGRTNTAPTRGCEKPFSPVRFGAAMRRLRFTAARAATRQEGRRERPTGGTHAADASTPTPGSPAGLPGTDGSRAGDDRGLVSRIGQARRQACT